MKYPVVPAPRDPKDHVAWLHYWSRELLEAIHRELTTPSVLHEEHVVRCARAAHGRASRLSQRMINQLRQGESMTNRMRSKPSKHHVPPAPAHLARAKKEKTPKIVSQDAALLEDDAQLCQCGHRRDMHARHASLCTLCSTCRTFRAVLDSVVAAPVPSPLAEFTAIRSRTVELIKKSKQPSKSNAISYIIAGLRGDVRFPKAMFDGEPPATIPLTANFVAPKPPKEAKVKLTAEQRKALKASQPKPTEAERIAAREARLAKEAANLAARKAKLQEASL